MSKHGDYLRAIRVNQIVNTHTKGTNKHSIVETINHMLRIFRDAEFTNEFDFSRKEAAISDLYYMNELLVGLKEGG